MFDQTRKADLRVMLDLAKVENPETEDDVPTQVLVPAFVISELTRAFKIGFLIFLPFFLDRYGCRRHIDVDGYDDATTSHDLTTLQSATLCFDRWLESSDR